MTDPCGDVLDWLEDVVVGLNLCPFAALPLRSGRVRITATHAADEDSLLTALRSEMKRLCETSGEELETTLVVLSSWLTRFDDFNQFLDLADALIDTDGLAGVVQIASFHPHYQFAGSLPDDRSNLTNRSPWPILHILREQSVTAALMKHGQPDDISRNNIRRVGSLDESEMRALFPWLG